MTKISGKRRSGSANAHNRKKAPGKANVNALPSVAAPSAALTSEETVSGPSQPCDTVAAGLEDGFDRSLHAKMAKIIGGISPNAMSEAFAD